MKEKTFYKACKGIKSENDEILDNYIKGYYFNKTTGLREVIPEGANKYNKQFLSELAELNKQFYGTIMTFGIAVRIIKKHKENCFGDIKNLYRLMDAQGGTIRFNKLLRASLRKYQVNNKMIYRAIARDVDTQKDRIKRNRKMMEQLFVDYGMKSILESVERDTGLNIFDHCVKFLEEAENDTIILSDEDEARVHEKAKEDYIKYLENLASSNGISLYDNITTAIVDRIEANSKMHDEIVNERKERKEKEFRRKQADVLHKDNLTIQSEVNMLEDIIDRRITGVRLDSASANKMHNRVDQIHGPIYYIAAVKQYSPRYVGENRLLTSSIANARLFESAELAQGYLESVIDKLNGYYVKVMKLIVLKKKEEIESRVNLDYYIKSVLESPGTVDERLACKKVVEGVFGVEGYRSSGEAYIYGCDSPKVKRRILCETQYRGVIPGDAGHNMMVRPVKEKYHRDIQLEINGWEVEYKCKKVQFDCKLYQSRLNALCVYDANIRSTLHGDIGYGCRIYGMDSVDSFEKLKDRVYELSRGYNRVYYILGVSIHAESNRAYCRESNAHNYTQSIGTMDLFTSYEQALMWCRLLTANEESAKYVWRVMILI